VAPPATAAAVIGRRGTRTPQPAEDFETLARISNSPPLAMPLLSMLAVACVLIASRARTVGLVGLLQMQSDRSRFSDDSVRTVR